MQVDTGFIHNTIPRTLEEKKKNPELKEKVKKFYFILILDVLSRYIYAKPLPEQINKTTLKKAFDELLEEKMPNFNVLKSDLDPSLLKIKGKVFGETSEF